MGGDASAMKEKEVPLESRGNRVKDALLCKRQLWILIFTGLARASFGRTIFLRGWG